MTYRLIVCFDLEADSLKEAYGFLENQIGGLGIAWETSDEWYDQEGEPGDPDILQKAIVAYLMEREHDLRTCDNCGHRAKEHKEDGKCSIAKSDTATGYKSVQCRCPGLLTVVEDATKKTDTGA